jgi:hypothetical protein
MGRWMDRLQRGRKRVRSQNTLHKGTYTVALTVRHSSSQAIPRFPFSMGSLVCWETYLTSGRRGVEGFAAAIGAFACALVDMLNGVEQMTTTSHRYEFCRRLWPQGAAE